MKYHNIFLLLLSITLASCVTSGPTKKSNEIPANFLYAGSYINIHAPNSSGWHLLESSNNGMAFARGGGAPSANLAAQVSMFNLPKTETPDEFLSFIKRGIAKDTDSTRFDNIESDFSYTEERGYPCVRIKNTTRDNQAQTGGTRKEQLLLQMESLYCRHPIREQTGFSVTYSHRGLSLYPKLSTEAKAFIAGVQVPTQKDKR